MIEYLEPRELLTGAAVNPTTSAADVGVIQLNETTGDWQASRFNGTQFNSETVASWENAVPQTVVVHGDLWATGAQDLVQYDPATGSFHGQWQSGSGVAEGVLFTWVPSMDLQFLTMQDLNHDGRDDVIAMDRNTGNWATSTSRADGSYDTRFIGTWQTGVDWQHVAFTDLNGDNYDDIVGYNPNAKTWNALFGTQSAFLDATYANPIVSGSLSHVVVGNFDGVVGTEILERDLVSGNWVAISFVNGRFSSKVVGNWDAGSLWSNVHTLDFWGTGRKAIVGLNTQTNEWRLTWSAGSGFATSTISIWSAGSYVDAQVADLNHDGREEVVARQLATGRWYQLSSSSTSIQTTLLGTWQPGASYDLVRSGDFNNDSRVDLIGMETGTGIWRGLLSNPNGSYSTTALARPAFGYVATNIGVGDLNADGRLDVFSRDAGTENWQIISVGGGALQPLRFNSWTAYGTGWRDPQVINFDGTGDNDLLARDAATGDWWLTTFVGTIPTTTKVANWNPSVTWQNWQTIDFDGNGTVDVLARNATTGDWHLLRTVNGVVTSTAIANWSTATNWIDFQVADLFGNGKPLIIARNAATNEWQGLWSVGSGFSTNPLKGMVAGRSYVDTKVVNFFGDGRETVVTRDASTGAWYGLWFAPGRFNLTALGAWSTVGNWHGVTVADLGGTGREAVYGYNTVTGYWNRMDFDGVAGTQTAVALNLEMRSLDLTSAGNFIDAGRDAILTHSTFNNHWYRFTQDTNGYLLLDLGIWPETAGWTTTSVADVNRDGRADLVGYFPAASSWKARTFDGINWTSIHLGNANATAKVTDIPGASDATLRAIILADTPGLSAAFAAGDTRTTARLLRNWAANAVDSALFSNPLLNGARTASEAYFGSYAINKAGSTCGGVGEFYVNILRLFGIDSLTIGLGDTRADALIHTTVVVPIQNQGSWSFEVFDPTFNCTFVDALSGNNLSYSAIVSAVQASNTANVSVEESATLYRGFLSRIPYESPDMTLVGIVDGIYNYRWPNYGLDDYVRVNQSTFTSLGYASGNAGFYQLMAKVLIVNPNNGSGNSSTSQNQRTLFLSELSRQGITVPN